MGNYSTTVHGLYLLITVQWTYNLGQNRMELTLSPPPTPQSNDEGREEQKRVILASLKWGRGVVSINVVVTQALVSSYTGSNANVTARQAAQLN